MQDASFHLAADDGAEDFRQGSAQSSAAPSAHTPGPWFVRKLERFGVVSDCFVAAKDVNGFAYDAQILGEDEYREGSGGMTRMLADAERIVLCVNLHDELVEALRYARRFLKPEDHDTAFVDAAIAKATGEQA